MLGFVGAQRPDQTLGPDTKHYRGEDQRTRALLKTENFNLYRPVIFLLLLHRTSSLYAP
jgi:hypothetical protein